MTGGAPKPPFFFRAGLTRGLTYGLEGLLRLVQYEENQTLITVRVTQYRWWTAPEQQLASWADGRGGMAGALQLTRP